MKTHRFFIKSLSMFLAVLMTILVVPLSVYAEIFDVPQAEVHDDATSGQLVKPEVYELVDRREENVKHFKLSDGTVTAVMYETPVHYLDGNGEWQDIDNTLADDGSEYATSNSRVKFAKKTTGNGVLFTLHENNTKITVSLDGAKKKVAGRVTNTITENGEETTELQKQMTLDKLSSRILYPDILDGVDLEYVVKSGNIKENIIVKEYLNSYSYSFTVSLNNLTAILNSDGSISLTNGVNETVYTIPSGYMYDANGEYSEAVTYTLADLGNGKYTFRVTADASWVNAADRAFPVTIDPPIVSRGYNITDLYVSSENPTSNYKTSQDLTVRTSCFKSYFKVNNLPTLPESAYITDAFIKMKYIGGDEINVGVYQVITDWDSTLTWNDIPAKGEHSAAWLDYNKILSSNGSSYWHSWDITSLVHKWYDGSSPNYGVCFSVVNDVSSNTTARFHSSESTTVNSSPYFTINYRDMKGLESYWTQISQSAGLAGTGNVNVANGSLTFLQSTVSSTDNLFGFSPALVYNSAVAGQEYSIEDIPVLIPYMPYGFKLNMNETIVQKSYVDSTGANAIYYVWSDGDGTDHAFFATDSYGYTYRDEDGLQLKLNINSAATTGTITDQNHTVRHFDRIANSANQMWYYLTSIEDESGNKLEFVFDNMIPIGINIVPNGGSRIEQLKIAYNDGLCPAVIWCPHSGEAMLFRYSETPNGSISSSAYKYLREIVYVMNKGNSLSEIGWLNYYNGSANSNIVVNATAYYTYDTAGRLMSAKDGDSGYEVRYNYSSGRVYIVQERASDGTAGQKIVFKYNDGYTEVRSSGTDDVYGNTDDILTNYVFDREGRVISSYSSNTSKTDIYGVANGEYVEENENAKNSLKVSAHSTGSNSANYLLNGGFEEDMTHWTKTDNVSEGLVNGDRSVLNNKQANFSVYASEHAYITQYVFLRPGSYSLSMDILNSVPKNVTVTLSAQSVNDGSNVVSETIRDNATLGKYYAFLDFTANNVANGGEVFAITVSVKASSTVASAVVSIDNVMLAKAIGAQSYNLVQNGSFDNNAVNSSGTTLYTPAAFWQRGIESDLSSVTTANLSEPFMRSLSVPGDVDCIMSVEQVLYSSPYQSLPSEAFERLPSEYPEVLIISAFGKATSVLPNNDSKFALRLEITYFTYNDDPVTEEKYFDFSKETDAWQYLSGTYIIPAGKAIKELKICCEYSNNVGMAYFDDISVQYSPDGETDQYYYNEEGLLGVHVSGRNATVYKYYSDGDVLYSCNNNGVTWYEYDLKHRVTLEEYYTFSGDFWHGNLIDSNGNLKPSSDSAWSSFEYNIDDITLNYANKYEYNEYGLPTNTTFKSYENSSTAMSDKEMSADTITPTEILSSYTTYNLGNSKHFGSVDTETDTLGKTTRYFYEDDSGRLKAIITPDGTSGTVYDYDDFGRLDMVRPVICSGETLVVRANTESVDYDYSNGHLTTITTESTTYTLGYDVFGNNTNIAAGDCNLATYAYNANNGKLSSITYGNGFKVGYTYDALDRIETVLYNDTVVYRYNYDSAGNINKLEDLENGKTYIYKYDLKNRLTHAYENNSYSNAVSSSLIFYDNKSRPEYLYHDIYYSTSAGTKVLETLYANEYNEDGNVDKYRVESGNTKYHFDPQYDTMDRVKKRTVTLDTLTGTLINTVDYEFTANGTNTSLQISKYTSKINSVTTNTYRYVYDDNGNITQIIDASNDELLYAYEYDDLGQLTREDNRPLNKSYAYTYDNAGNITSKTEGYFSLGSFTAANEPILYTYSEGAWGDQLISICGGSVSKSYGYDTLGNLTGREFNGLFYLFTWNGRQLDAYETNTSYVTFKYNANGQRIQRSYRDGTVAVTYEYNGDKLVCERYNGTICYYIYDENGSISGMRYHSSSYDEGVFDEYLFEKNLQGDVVAVYDINGTKLVSYTYDAWGNFEETYHNGGRNTSVTNNPFRYRGYYYDSDLGLYYLNTRYYSPELGRFISADAADVITLTPYALTDKNLYAYCDNNPIMRKDDGGEFWNTIIGAVVGATWGGLSAVLFGTDIVAGMVSGALSGAISGAALDIAIATGGVGLIALSGVVLASGVGGAAGSYVNQIMSDKTHDEVDWGEVIVDGVWGAIGGALSFGVADVGGKTCQTLAKNLALRGKAFWQQVGNDFLTTLAITFGTWLNGTKMKSLQ